ncbi:hypothetical protein BKA00_003726 [Actinomadura coerulea]|uniref:Uncharacterized protein n=1 Tax=Actinomadura coerulea TaxID=46159 RepID=A0A7X0KZV1_9ACTN|nr:hypothetical protein [Actinomadura coerulea]MBB6396812.1 hypothetical protein [Actinomadura coerulea]GGP94680.1 hypothetical protein GCM10010187_07510 [Actinomadura coerulea]
MGQPGMRITVDAAMRARDVSRPRGEGGEPPAAGPGPGSGSNPNKPGDTARRTKAAKNERRRLDKRGPRRPPENAS